LIPLVKRSLAESLTSGYNPLLIAAAEEKIMFREEKETLDGLKVKLEELRGYL